MANVQESQLRASIEALEARGTRHHASSSGLGTAEAIKQMFQAAVGQAWADLQYELRDHNEFSKQATSQKSLIVTLPAPNPDAPTVIVGAHLDSINREGGGLPAPGGDDDASGVASLIEIARVLAGANARMTRRLEFHFYAAEEIGLIGSQHIAQSYRQQRRIIGAMLQMDMNSYSAAANDSTIYLVTNKTDSGLRRSLKELLNTYLGGQFKEQALSAGTSDHQSWTNQGYRAVFPFESPSAYNPTIHTAADRLNEKSNLALSARFVRLGIAFVAHHAGLIGSGDKSLAAAVQDWRAKTGRDIKIALDFNATTGSTNVGLAAGAGIDAIEVCLIHSPGGTACQEDRIPAKFVRTVGERRLFALDIAINLNGERQRLGIFAYDQNEKLVAQRSVRVEGL